jgi:hypothetical protein
MGRAKTQAKRTHGIGTSPQLNDPKTASASVDRYDGRKRPAPPTVTEAVSPDIGTPRVIKTRD